MIWEVVNMMRLAAFLLALALLCPAALGETFIVDYAGSEEEPGYALLLKDDGAVLAPPETFGELSELRGGDAPLYRATPFSGIVAGGGEMEDEDYRIYHREALVDGGGRALTDFLYYDLTLDPSGAVIGRRWPEGTDVLDDAGQVLFSGAYSDLRPTGEGGFLALRQDGASYAVLTVGADGAIHETGLHTGYDRLNAYEGGLCAVNEIHELGGKAAFLNAKGERAKQTFDYISDICHGRAVVQTENLYGLYELSGRYLLPPVYDYIQLCDSYSRPIYIAQQGSDVEVYDAATGEKLLSRSYPGAEYVYCWMPSDGILQVGDDYDSREICDLSGDTLFRVQDGRDVMCFYSEAEGQPLRFVESVGDWPDSTTHIIDLNGKPVGPEWQRLDAALWKDGHGRYITTRFDLSPSPDGEYYPVWHSFRSGVCDEDGEVILDTVYNSVRVLSLDRYWVDTPVRAGMIDGAGKWYYAIEKYSMLMD